MNVYYFLIDLINIIMGKRLIIKGADFSKNGIQYSLTWYSNNTAEDSAISCVYGLNVNNFQWNDNLCPGFTLSEQFRGRPVNIIRTRIASQFRNASYATKLKYPVFYQEATAINTEVKVLRKITDFTLSADDIKKDIIEIHLPETITLASDNLSGISIGVPLADLPSDALADLNAGLIQIPCAKLSSKTLYYVEINKQFKSLSNVGVGIDYGYEQ